jgi:hypothetical protein
MEGMYVRIKVPNLGLKAATISGNAIMEVRSCDGKKGVLLERRAKSLRGERIVRYLAGGRAEGI